MEGGSRGAEGKGREAHRDEAKGEMCGVMPPKGMEGEKAHPR